MTTYFKNFGLYILIVIYLIIIIIFPFELYILNICSEIFPAFDIIVIYYFATYRKVELYQLFITGFFLDPFFNLPYGVNSLIFIMAELLIKYLSKRMVLREYIINLLIFILYAFLIVLSRAMFANIFNFYNFEGYSIYFYFLTTILAYPALKALIHKIMKLI